MLIENVVDVSSWDDNTYTATVDGVEEVFFFNDTEFAGNWPACQNCGKETETNSEGDVARRVYATETDVFVCSECLEKLCSSSKAIS